MSKADYQCAVLCAAWLSDTALRLVEVNVTAVDWLANFSDYKVTIITVTRVYEVVQSAFKIQI